MPFQHDFQLLAHYLNDENSLWTRPTTMATRNRKNDGSRSRILVHELNIIDEQVDGVYIAGSSPGVGMPHPKHQHSQ